MSNSINAFTEADLEEYMISHYIHEDCGMDPSNITQQFDLGKYGRADIITWDIELDSIRVNIFELKVSQFEYGQLIQLSRYMAAMRRLCQEYKDVYIEGTLVVPEIDMNFEGIWLLQQLSDNISILEYTFSLKDGISLDYGDYGGVYMDKDIEQFPKESVNAISSINKKRDKLVEEYKRIGKEAK